MFGNPVLKGAAATGPIVLPPAGEPNSVKRQLTPKAFFRPKYASNFDKGAFRSGSGPHFSLTSGATHVCC